MRGVQAGRPSLYDLQDQMRELTVPTLIVNGDEDDPCLAPGMMMKSLIQSSAHVVLPRTGHATNPSASIYAYSGLFLWNGPGVTR